MTRELEARCLQRILEFPPSRSVVPVPEVEAYLERLSQDGVRLTARQKADVF